MRDEMIQEVRNLERLSMPQAKAKFAELFGESPRTGNRTWLLRRIAWRLQSIAEGDLSERARRRASELADDADLRMTPPRAQLMDDAAPSQGADCMNSTGTILLKLHKGRRIEVAVLENGFAWNGVDYPTLSAVATAIVGEQVDGFRFFGLPQRKEASS